MRSAKEAGNFPYTMGTVCYIEVNRNGSVSQIPHKNKSDRPNALAAYKRAVSGESALYAVWPGNWRSDLFIIDDLESFAERLNLFDEEL